MFESDANHSKVLDSILQAANKHPNSRVSKLIHSVEEDCSQKNIVLLLIELAEHPEYATDFGISLSYYLDLFEQLGIGRDIVLNEAGLLLLNSSKVYARRVDFVQELVERQILTLSNTEKEMVDNRPENSAKTSTEKLKRSRKRLVEAVEDPYEVELVPRKFRKLAEEKRFGGINQQDKAKVTTSKFYRIESEQYIHPVAWMHASIVDLENEEDIDSKRNYKLFTYHVEHRYNTLVPDINFRLYFKVKDYIDEEEERLAEREEQSAIDAVNDLADWPPLSEEYIQKYLDLENKVLDIGEILRHRKKPRLDDILIEQLKISKNKVPNQEVQNSKGFAESIIDCNQDLLQLDLGIDSSVSLNNTSAIDTSTNANESELLAQSSIQEDAIRNEADLSLTNLTAPTQHILDLTQHFNSTEKSLLECTNQTENSIDASNTSTQKDLTYSNVNANSSNLNENESGYSENVTGQTDSNVSANSNTLNVNDSGCSENATGQLRNDTGLGESISEQTNQLSESSSNLANSINADALDTACLGESISERTNQLSESSSNLANKINDDALNTACRNGNSKNQNENPSTIANKEAQNETESVALVAASDKKAVENAAENVTESEKIRVYLPHLDDEGVYLSDLDDHEQRMLSPKVLTTDVFPSIPNKENITVYVDDEIRTLLNIVEEDEPPITYTMPVQILPPTTPIVLNIFKFPEKILRRRILFKLGAEMDLFLQSRSMKRTHHVDMSETRQYRPMKLFSDSQNVTIESNDTRMRTSSATDCNVLSDDEDAEDFLGFTEEEQANKMTHRLSRDSGVDDADLQLTPSIMCSMRVINEDFDKAIKELQEQISEDSRNDEMVGNVENVAPQNDAENCVDVTANEVGEATATVESTTSTMAITNDLLTNNNCIDKETTETASTALTESCMKENVGAVIENSLNENVAAVIENSLNENVAAVMEDNINTAHESGIDDEPTFRDSGLFTQDDLLDMDNVHEIEKSKTKIQKWHEYLQPILSKARDRHHFDVFQLGTEIMNELQKPKNSTRQITATSITFQDVMTDKDESYVSRYFLSTLLLANQNNIKINVKNKCTEKPSTWDDIKLDLLDTKRHTVAIEDNIGIINTTTISTTDNTKHT
ncbi:serine-rich adhesin for platelets isoform X2 [Eurosta solidaginis]|uniref:serine-rich adhesin for platelets isoform X2 n=1 Tax=Eurosta solidaginis TaxID=178769 RepID=UPI003530DDB0